MEDYQLMMAAFRENRLEHKKHIIDEWEAELQEEEKSAAIPSLASENGKEEQPLRPSLWVRYKKTLTWVGAASVLVAVILVVNLLSEPKKRLADYDIGKDSIQVATFMSSTDPLTEIFNSRNYQMIIDSLLGKERSSAHLTANENYLLGFSFFALANENNKANYDLAYARFEAMLERPNELDISVFDLNDIGTSWKISPVDAKWYQAQILLEKGKKRKAKRMLKGILSELSSKNEDDATIEIFEPKVQNLLGQL
ncbi:MAG: hypothetical protein R2824_09820 [Saprospiraceae bacterium]|nr:hypothetical protein [Lewinella sp.]